jgi:DNA-binding transcriptional regulator YhcF (GntR family)
VITTTRAYTDLEQEGFVARQQGKGSYVLPKNSEIVREQLLRKVEEGLVVDEVYRLCRGTQNLTLQMQTSLIRIGR